MATLGRAFIEVHADTSPFARELRQQMRRLATDMREDSDRAGRLIGQRLGLQARRGLRESFGRRALALDARINLSGRSVATTEAALNRVTRNREVDVRINRRGLTTSLGIIASTIGIFALNVIRIFGDLFNFGRQIGQIFGEAFKNLSQVLTNSASSAASVAGAFAQLAAGAAAVAAIITLLVGVFGVLLALLIPLVETVQLLSVLLPGLAVGFLFSILPLVLVFSNLGQAIKETGGELDSFNNAIEDLGNGTQGVLRSLRTVIQFFQGIRKEVQEEFFDPIFDAIVELDRALGPTFRDGFLEVAAAAGEFAASFIDMFDHPLAIPFFEALFELAELGFEEIGDAGLNLLGAFANLTFAAIPELRRSVDSIADTINDWADSINDFANDPNFQDTLDEWKESFETIRDLFDEVVRLAGNLIDGFREDGLDVVKEFTSELERMNEFFESDDGEEFFDGLRIAALGVLIVVGGLVATTILWITLLGQIDELFSEEGILGGALALGAPLALLVLQTFNWRGILQGIRDLFRQEGILGGILGLITPMGFLLTRSATWRNILQGIRDWWNRITEGVRRFVDLLSGRGRPILFSIRNVVNGIRTIIRGWRSAFSGAVTFARRVLSPIRTIRTIASRIGVFARAFRDALSSAAFYAGRIRDIIGNIRVPNLGGLAGLAANAFFQEGGIVTRPTSALIGEAGPEVVIPLTRPNRARELLAVTGLAGLIRGGDGGSVGGGVGAAVPTIRLQFQADGSAAGDAILELLRRSVRIRGGDVQVVIGQ